MKQDSSSEVDDLDKTTPPPTRRRRRRDLVHHLKSAERATRRHTKRFVVRRIDNARLVARQATTWLVLVALLIAGLGVQMAWGKAGYTEQAARGGGIYIEGTLGPIDTLNPLYTSSSAEASAAKLLFSSLYSYDSSGNLRPEVAAHADINSAGTKYTVTLKQGVKWHDGETLDAHDVIFTLDLIKDPDVRSPLAVNWRDVTVKEVDSYTIEFSLPAVYAAFPHALIFPILPEHVLADLPPEEVRSSSFSQSPVGSGPFMFNRLQTGVRDSYKALRMSANPEYFRGAPKLSKFEIQAYDSEDSLMEAVSLGEVTAAADLPITELSGLNSSKYRVTSIALDSGVYMIFNLKSDSVKDKTIRKALQLGTDTVDLRRRLGGGTLPLDGPLLASQMGQQDYPKAPNYNFDQAKKLLEKAGWKYDKSQGSRVKKGVKLQLSITTVSSSEYAAVTNLVAEQWRKLGVDVLENVIDTSNASTSFTRDVLQTRNFDILLYKVAIGADPDVYAYWHSSQGTESGFNFAGYANSLVDANLASARSRLDTELRQAKYKQFVKQWLEDAPAIALYRPVIEYVANQKVRGIDSGDVAVSSADRYADVIYWTAREDSVYKTP